MQMAEKKRKVRSSHACPRGAAIFVSRPQDLDLACAKDERIKRCKGDAEKLRFCREALEQADPFAAKECLDPELQEIVAWIASRSAEEVNTFRVDALQRVEEMARAFEQSGATKGWLQRADPVVRQVSDCVCRVSAWVLPIFPRRQGTSMGLFSRNLHRWLGTTTQNA